MNESSKDGEFARGTIEQHGQNQNMATHQEVLDSKRRTQVDQDREYRLFKVLALAWPVGWVVFTIATVMLQIVVTFLSAAVLIVTAAAVLANIWGGVLVWRDTGHCPRWLPIELLLFVAVPVAVFVVASAVMRNVGWAGP